MRSIQRYLMAATVAAAAAFPLASPASLDAQARTAEPFAWDGPLAAGTTLEIKGVNGAIRAVAGSGTTARVVATRSARRSDPSEVEIVVVPHSEGVTICAVYPSGRLARNECRPGERGRLVARNNDVQVEFTVELPPAVNFVARTTNGPVTTRDLSARVEAFSSNGTIRIEGAGSAHARTTNGSVTVRSAGDADVRTANGRITAHLASLEGASPLRFTTTNGSITVTVPADARANIDAATTNGRIRTDLPLTVQGNVSRNRLAGTLGGGGRAIHLRTTNGSIVLENGG